MKAIRNFFHVVIAYSKQLGWNGAVIAYGLLVWAGYALLRFISGIMGWE